ncbi:DUF3025 domain-containing protein [Rheinheimera pacifica]|uniref:DUF3025 domain-containing protein n=1 Tax=Rheinheimera pacifica TaxID=173990 RepID=UPI002481AF21|nr:DUF3025 domain-containing protein [Rheinheimera pacifica]
MGVCQTRLLKPYGGVDASSCKTVLTAAYSFVDAKLHEQIANEAVLLDNQQLTPLPLLGVPRWYNDNETAGFYHNTDYFRPKRQR